MEEFNISSNKLQKLAALKELLQKGVENIFLNCKLILAR